MSVHSRLLKFFPVPSFLIMPSTCIAVSDESLKYISLKKGKRSIEVEGYAEKSISNGIIESGEIKKPSEVRNILEEMKKEIDMYYVSVSLPEDKGYIYTTSVSAVEGRITEDQVAFTLEQNVPFAVDEVLFDYVETGVKNKSGREVVVMVLPKSVIEGYINVFKQTNIIPISFEIESFSLSRAVVNSGDPRTHLLVNIKKDNVNISVVCRNIPRFTSTVFGSVESSTNKDSYKAALWLNEEVDKVVSYWESHGSLKTSIPQTIILCGDIAGQTLGKEVISSNLNIEVNIANVWENVASFDEYIPDIPHFESLRFGTAIGLALNEYNRRN